MCQVPVKTADSSGKVAAAIIWQTTLAKEIPMLFRSLLNCLMPHPNPHWQRRAVPRTSTCRLAVEALEERCTPAAMLAIGDSTVLEGNVGTHNAVVAVTLSEPHGNNI